MTPIETQKLFQQVEDELNEAYEKMDILKYRHCYPANG